MVTGRFWRWRNTPCSDLRGLSGAGIGAKGGQLDVSCLSQVALLCEQVNLAGRHVTEQLMKLLVGQCLTLLLQQFSCSRDSRAVSVGQGHPLNSTADFETVREAQHVPER